MTCSFNCTRFAIAAIAGFIFTFVFDFIVHGIMIMPLYDATADLWRPESTMMEYLPTSMIVSFLTVATLLYIFTRHYEGKGINEGVRFGAMMGVLIGLISFGMYVYLPIPITLAVAWFASSLVWLIGLGIVFSLTYKK